MQKINISPGQIFDGIHVRLLRVATGAITARIPSWCRCGYPEFILIREGAVRSEFKEAPGRFIERPAHSIIHFPQDSIRRTWLASEEQAPYVSLTFSARSDLLFDLFGLLKIPDFIRSEEAETIMCRLVPLVGAEALADQLLVQELLVRFLRIVVTQSTIREEAARCCRERWFQEVAACIDSEPGRAFSPGVTSSCRQRPVPEAEPPPPEAAAEPEPDAASSPQPKSPAAITAASAKAAARFAMVCFFMLSFFLSTRMRGMAPV